MSVPEVGLIDEGSAIENYTKIHELWAQEADFMIDLYDKTNTLSLYKAWLLDFHCETIETIITSTINFDPLI